MSAIGPRTGEASREVGRSAESFKIAQPLALVKSGDLVQGLPVCQPAIPKKERRRKISDA